MLVSHHDLTLVIFSIAIAVLASYVALNMAGRVFQSRGRIAVLWLIGGGFSMGLGIWSMHFVGMLAYTLPIPLGYDLNRTLMSLLVAVVSSTFALWVVCRKRLEARRLVAGAMLMGCGMASMHYLGMGALLMAPAITYDPLLFALSIIVAILSSGLALWMTFRLRYNTPKTLWMRLGASVVMGLAIGGLHYTGMASAQFPVGSVCAAVHHGIDPQWLAALVIVMCLAVSFLTLILSLFDSRTRLLGEALAHANDELVHQVLHDHLTELPNRLLLDDRLQQNIAKASREGSSFAVLFMDLDGFKAVNDAYGHHVGDLLLIEVAKRVLAATRKNDSAARLGGDEFVVLASTLAPEGAAILAERLIKSIAASYTVENHTLHISASIGIAVYPNNGSTQHELMINADAAMYHAKKQGRNGYCFFENAMNINAHEQLQLQHELRNALTQDEFLLYYQPKMIAPDGPVSGVEALLRWMHPIHGLTGPDAFLPSAEKTGLIIPIGKWVINEACRQMRAWKDEGHHDWTVAVNLSALQLCDVGIVSTVRLALERHDLAPHHLVIEITESTAMQDAESSLATLEQLSTMGVGISIDDFGTGHSSLLYLKRLPATELKIDRGFISELTQGNNDAAIISAIIALGHTLDLKIVAEGVETLEQQAVLTGLGCNTLQGFLLGRPMAADNLTKMYGKTSAAVEEKTP